MNFQGSFDKTKYNELLNYLDTIKDIKYQNFSKRVVVYDNVLGIKLPMLKQISKQISKNDYLGFIKNNKSDLYELTLIEGLIYGYLKIPFDDLIQLLNQYVLKLKSWAQVDSVATSLKIFKKETKKGFAYAKKLIHNKNNFVKRFGIIILLSHFLHDEYIDKVLELVSKIKSDDYYVSMAIAWLMSVSYIKYKEKTLVYLVNIKNDFIYNKTLSKIIESNRVNKNEKEFIRGLKRK